MRWDWVTTTPFRGITLNQEGEDRVRWLTDAEQGRLVATAAPGCAISYWWDSIPDCAGAIWWACSGWLHEHGTVLVVPRQLVKAKKATVMIPLTTRAADHHCAKAHTGAPCVFTHTEDAPTPWNK